MSLEPEIALDKRTEERRKVFSKLKSPSKARKETKAILTEGKDRPTSRSIKGDVGTLVFGLEWRQLTGLDGQELVIKKSKEIRQTAKKLKALRYVEIGFAPSIVAGFYKDKPPKKEELYSAAAYVASTAKVENSLFFYAFDTPNTYAVIGVRDKKPLAGFDVVGTRDEVMNVGRRFLQRAQSTGVQIYFDGEFDDEFKIKEFHPNSEWHPFVNSYAVESAKLKPLPSEAKKIAAIGAIAVVAGGAYIGIDTYLEQQRRLEQLARKKDPIVLYQRSLQTMLENEFQQTAKLDAQRYFSAVGNLPTRIDPRLWRMESIACTSGSCEISWLRINGTNKDLMAHRDSNMLVFQDDLKHASERIVVPLAPTYQADSTTFPTSQEFKISTGSMLQTFAQVKILVNVEPAALAGSWPKGLPAAGAPIVKRGNWTIGGPLQFRDTLLDLPSNMSLSTYTISFSQTKATFEAKGYYYVR